MKWRRLFYGCLIFIAVERFCYFQTASFSLSKMVYEKSPPSPTSFHSLIELQQPLHFIGAGKQFYVFETADKKYVVKFMKWSRRRPLPWLEKCLMSPKLVESWKTGYLAARAHRAKSIQQSTSLALNYLCKETQLVIPVPQKTFTLIDNLGISHTVDSKHTHFFVQRKAIPFTHHFQSHLSDAKFLLRSFIQTVAAQCHQGICNLDPMIHRNYGVVDNQVILLDIGSFFAHAKLHHPAAIHHEIVLELLPLRKWLQTHYPEYLSTFDALLIDELHAS